MRRRIQFMVEVELIPELGLDSDEQARDMLEEAIRGAGADEMMRVMPGMFVIEQGPLERQPAAHQTYALINEDERECPTCREPGCTPV